MATMHDHEKGEYDFDDDDDVKRFIKEVVLPAYEEEIADGYKPQFFACSMAILTGLHRVMEDREYNMAPVGRFFDADDKPRDLAEGELRLEWSGAGDYSWVIL